MLIPDFPLWSLPAEHYFFGRWGGWVGGEMHIKDILSQARGGARAELDKIELRTGQKG